MSTCADQCPICKTSLVDQCCETCGSLEGVDQDSFAASRVFGYDWAAGSVAPWRDAQGRAYATPAELAEVALVAAGLERGGYVIDLGCGDAAILRAAATRYGCCGLGLDIDDGALADAARAIEADGVGELVSVRRGDLNEFDLACEIDHADAPVVVTCYLLPATLRELRPQLEDAVHRGAAVILFRWDCGPAWQGPPGRRDDRGFTVYKMDPDRLSPLVDVGLLGVNALAYVDAASLGRLSACARLFGNKDEDRSLCEDAAHRRLRADEGFRDAKSGEMPTPNSSRWDRDGFVSVWGRYGFPGWLLVLRDWERAMYYERRGGYNAFTLGVKLQNIEEMNLGARSLRKMKRVLNQTCFLEGLKTRPGDFRLLLSMPDDVADRCARDEDPQAATDEYCRMLRYNEALAAAKLSH